MQAEDNFHVCFAAAAVTGEEKPSCLWWKSSGKKIPRKKRHNKPWNDAYKSHHMHLKNAFESSVFVLKLKEGIGFGVHTTKDMSPSCPEDKKGQTSVGKSPGLSFF
eukprot:1246081-Ditylum_brightwellii.AAC.1